MLAVEGVRSAQERFGKGKVVTGEQVRWGLENLNLDQKKLDALGFAGVMRPVSTCCVDHMGSSWARIHTWDGPKCELHLGLVPSRRVRSSSPWSRPAPTSTRPTKAGAPHPSRLPKLIQPLA